MYKVKLFNDIKNIEDIETIVNNFIEFKNCEVISLSHTSYIGDKYYIDKRFSVAITYKEK